MVACSHIVLEATPSACRGKTSRGVGSSTMDVVIVASFEEFDETLEKRFRGPGNGKKHAVQAMLHFLCSQAQTGEEIRQVDCMVMDWKNPPKGSAKDVEVTLHRGASQKAATWGSREQLAAKFPASRWDVVITTHTKRLLLDFAGSLKARRHFAMVHDYNLPFGPWGQEQTAEQLKEHAAALEKFNLLCASKHLSEFIEKWGDGRYRTECCYAADYCYFDPVPEPLSLAEESHKFVTLVSPCPEKGLSILACLAETLPQVDFLAVKTYPWTKPWHEQFLKKLKNVKVEAASQSIDAVLRQTKVHLMF